MEKKYMRGAYPHPMWPPWLGRSPGHFCENYHIMYGMLYYFNYIQINKTESQIIIRLWYLQYIMARLGKVSGVF
jgi:hypothetical protein